MRSIFFDHQTFSLHRFGGVSRVFTREIEGLKKYSDVSVELGIIKSENENLLNSTLSAYYFKSPISFKGKTKLTYFINGLYSRYRLMTHSYDIIHPTLTDPYFVHYAKKSKIVITIHDIVPILYPEMMGKENQAIGKQMQYLSQRADHIMTISQASKDDIVTYLKVPEDKVTVALLGGVDPIETLPPETKLPEKYILYDGNRSGYKNFSTMIRAVTPLLLQDESLYVVCCGRAFTKIETALFEELKVHRKVLHAHTPNDHVLMYLFEHATLFIYPSMKEGFGIPVLQAFSFGTPVALSNIAVFNEVAGNFGFFFEPTQEESIRETVRQALSKPITQKDRETRKQYAASFSWDNHIKIVHDTYLSL